jgi:hypothetical protein
MVLPFDFEPLLNMAIDWQGRIAFAIGENLQNAHPYFDLTEEGDMRRNI